MEETTIREHLEAIAASRDVAKLLGDTPPLDRLYPEAEAWVQRWTPTLDADDVLPDCSCAVGRCRICN